MLSLRSVQYTVAQPLSSPHCLYIYLTRCDERTKNVLIRMSDNHTAEALKSKSHILWRMKKYNYLKLSGGWRVF